MNDAQHLEHMLRELIAISQNHVPKIM